MYSIHDPAPRKGEAFVALCSDNTGVGVYLSLGEGRFMEVGDFMEVTDESIFLAGSTWWPLADGDDVIEGLWPGMLETLKEQSE